MLLNKLRGLLYREQPKSADLLIGIISGMLGLSALLTRSTPGPRSPTTIAIERVAPIEFWAIALMVYAVAMIVSTLTERYRLAVFATGLGTFLWVSIVTTLALFLSFPQAITGVVIYGMFALFSMWSFVSIQEVVRLHKEYGPVYKRVLEEEMLEEIIKLRQLIQTATDDTESGYQQPTG